VNDTTTAPAQLTAADRCDRCGAQAFIRVVLPSGQDLLFCAHHGRQHEERLRALGGEWLDQRDDATEPSAN
jgi:hypothetical protein